MSVDFSTAKNSFRLGYDFRPSKMTIDFNDAEPDGSMNFSQLVNGVLHTLVNNQFLQHQSKKLYTLFHDKKKKY